MNAECTRTKLRFQGLDGREAQEWAASTAARSPPTAVASSCAKWSTGTRILGRLSECFTDHRDPDRIEHSVEALIKQRVLGAVPGLRGSQRSRRVVPGPAAGAAVLTGEFRRVESDRGKPLAGKSTLNRLELTPVGSQSTRRSWPTPAGMDELLVEVFLEAHAKAPEELILDLGRHG